MVQSLACVQPQRLDRRGERPGLELGARIKNRKSKIAPAVTNCVCVSRDLTSLASTMIIPITTRPQCDAPPAPPQLARLGNALYLIEMQGKLEVEGPREGAFVGTLTMDDSVRQAQAQAQARFYFWTASHDDCTGQSHAAHRRAPPRRQNRLASQTARDTDQAQDRRTDRIRNHASRVQEDRFSQAVRSSCSPLPAFFLTFELCCRPTPIVGHAGPVLN
jgi:hypothetical protein